MPHATRAGIRRIRDATDLGSTPGAGNDGYVLTWNNSTSAFVLSAGGGGSGSPGGSTTQVQYNNAGVFAGDAGLTYNATTDRLTIAGGIVAPSMRPASDSTTALQLQNAAGTAVLTVNTTDSSVLLAGRLGVSGQIANGLGRDGSTGQTIIYTANTSFAVWAANNGNAVVFSVTNNVIACSRLSASGGSVYGTAPFATTHLFGGGDYRPSGSVSGFAEMAFLAGQIYSPSPLTITDAATVYIDKAPFANATVPSAAISGNKWALWVDAGLVRFDDAITIGNSASPTALLDIAASTTARASLRIRSGTAPTTPNDGDIWNDGTDLKVRLGGVTYTLQKV